MTISKFAQSNKFGGVLSSKPKEKTETEKIQTNKYLARLDKACLNAVKHGDIAILEFIFSENDYYQWYKSVPREAAKFGHIHVLEYVWELYHKEDGWKNDELILDARNNNQEKVVEWLQTHGFEPKTSDEGKNDEKKESLDDSTTVSWHGRHMILQKSNTNVKVEDKKLSSENSKSVVEGFTDSEEGYEWSSNLICGWSSIYDEVSKTKDRGLIIGVLGLGINLGLGVLLYAIQKDRYQDIKFCCEDGVWNKKDVKYMNAAVASCTTGIGMIKLLLSEGFTFDETTAEEAAKHGHAGILSYLQEIGCPINKEACQKILREFQIKELSKKSFDELLRFF
jgi:hypothetical protein